MKKIYLSHYLQIFAVLFMISLVSAGTVVLTNDYTCQDFGITIALRSYPNIIHNQDYQYNIHIFNSTTGAPLSNDSVSCAIHMYNINGKHILSDNLVFTPDHLDFSLDIKGENFTRLGYYSYYVGCFTEDLQEGGICSSYLNVTQTGNDFTVAQAVVYAILIIITFIIFMLIAIPAIKLPFSNPKDKFGNKIGINWIKYPKLLLIWLAYVFFLWFMTLLSNMANNYLLTESIRNWITGTYTFVYGGAYVLTVVLICVFFVCIFMDLILKSLKKIIESIIGSKI